MDQKRTHQVESLDQFLDIVKQEPIQVPEITAPLPEGTSMLTPVNLYLRRDLLIHVLEANLTASQENTVAMALTDDERAELEAARQQREELLAWAQQETAEYLYMALYPVDGNLPIEEDEAPE